MAEAKVELTGLDELFDYKTRLMEDLLTDEEIVALIDEPGRYRDNPAGLVYTQVFPYEYVPDVTEHGKTFVCCEVDIKDVESKTFLLPAIYIWVFSHKSEMRLPEGGVRTDKLCSKIVEKINGSWFYGLGELELKSARRFSPISQYQGRALTFYARDFNRVSLGNKKIPANRKAW